MRLELGPKQGLREEVEFTRILGSLTTRRALGLVFRCFVLATVYCVVLFMSLRAECDHYRTSNIKVEDIHVASLHSQIGTRHVNVDPCLLPRSIVLLSVLILPCARSARVFFLVLDNNGCYLHPTRGSIDVTASGKLFRSRQG